MEFWAVCSCNLFMPSELPWTCSWMDGMDCYLTLWYERSSNTQLMMGTSGNIITWSLKSGVLSLVHSLAHLNIFFFSSKVVFCCRWHELFPGPYWSKLWFYYWGLLEIPHGIIVLSGTTESYVLIIMLFCPPSYHQFLIPNFFHLMILPFPLIVGNPIPWQHVPHQTA